MIGVEALIETMQGSYYFEPMESQKPYGDAPSVALFWVYCMLPLGIDQIQRRRRLGAFGLDIPEYYGGQSGAGGYGEDTEAADTAGAEAWRRRLWRRRSKWRLKTSYIFNISTMSVKIQE